ncbi:Ca2+:H+ antiporter [Pullulanibacillus pueri]|uniref:Ca(2+)/H(+) antiporter n=1 Tax=Pullulanibacillus pueri TaxID=1437324 RepID=A0A8J3EKP8_9BACL|nr:calcium/proton exchanger [Pullulanibacillus pueri]MBM7680229.1 Ca2+:H+ antiporter [Pullulanibacillus pueri]GGH76096.1 calcium/proton exchanger [Pullulanibacillus pueri]
MNRFFLILSIIGVPLSIFGSFLQWPDILMFAIYCLTIIGLASFMGRATESIAIVTGPSIGGLLNATFGNAVELIISFFALKEGLFSVVMASITGSVIGNLLLVGGLSIMVGGMRYKRQNFNVHDARHNTGIMMFAIIVAFIFPYIFSLNMAEHRVQLLSTVIAIVLILIYLFSLLFRLVTHRGIYKTSDDDVGHTDEKAEWGSLKAIIILAVVTLIVAYISEHLVDTIKPVGESFGWTETFIGVIIVAIVGNAAEHASAILMAYKNRMNVAIEIAIGSTLQISMFVAPVLVLMSWAFASFMPLVFPLKELTAMALATLLTMSTTTDGDTNWFEGAMLLAAYVIMGFGFYLL